MNRNETIALMYCMFRVVVALNQEHSRADKRRDSTATPAHQTYKHNRDRRRKPFNILRKMRVHWRAVT